MMKISIASDIHLEFGDLDLVNQHEAKVLILSGDVCVARDLGAQGAALWPKNQRIHDFFQRCADRFEHVIYVMGNHEHYHGTFDSTVAHMREHLGYLSNVRIMDCECCDIDNITFIAGTMWSDMNGRDPATMQHVKHHMNDFRVIWNRGRNRRFAPQDAAQQCKSFVDYVTAVISSAPSRAYVVVAHHAPSLQSVHELYRNDPLINGAYCSNLDEFILAHPQIKLWTHGHTHHNFDYWVGQTRVVCNPRGYVGYESQADQWQLQTVTL